MLSANFVENLDNYNVCSRCSMGLHAKVAEVPVTGKAIVGQLQGQLGGQCAPGCSRGGRLGETGRDN